MVLPREPRPCSRQASAYHWAKGRGPVSKKHPVSEKCLRAEWTQVLPSPTWLEGDPPTPPATLGPSCAPRCLDLGGRWPHLGLCYRTRVCTGSSALQHPSTPNVWASTFSGFNFVKARPGKEGTTS